MQYFSSRKLKDYIRVSLTLAALSLVIAKISFLFLLFFIPGAIIAAVGLRRADKSNKKTFVITLIILLASLIVYFPKKRHEKGYENYNNSEFTDDYTYEDDSGVDSYIWEDSQDDDINNDDFFYDLNEELDKIDNEFDSLVLSEDEAEKLDRIAEKENSGPGNPPDAN